MESFTSGACSLCLSVSLSLAVGTSHADFGVAAEEATRQFLRQHGVEHFFDQVRAATMPPPE
jgi:hypothetical protein